MAGRSGLNWTGKTRAAFSSLGWREVAKKFEIQQPVTILVCDPTGTPVEAYADSLATINKSRLRLFTQKRIRWQLCQVEGETPRAYALMDGCAAPWLYIEPWHDRHEELQYATVKNGGRFLKEQIRSPKMIAHDDAMATEKLARKEAAHAERKRQKAKQKPKRPSALALNQKYLRERKRKIKDQLANRGCD